MRFRFRQVVAAILAAVAILAVSSGPAGADDGNSWTLLYPDGPYAGAGWAACATPITVSVDTRNLKADQRAKARRALYVALARWNRSKTFTFQYGGEIPVRFDRSTGSSTPEDGVARDRWLYLTLVKAPKSGGADSQIVGLAGPLRIDPATKEIREASAAFRAQYVNTQSRARVALLFAHELGHDIGLGHSTSKSDIMYPVLNDQPRLGKGDIAGAQAVLKPCTTPEPTPVAGS
jgi:Matrixin